MKIFQIGFNKCGTTTIHRYLLANGMRSVHWDEGRLAQRVFRNLSNGDELLSGYENFDAFMDMDFLDKAGAHHLEAYKLFPYFARQYPDAVFILNTRDREDWIRSRLAFSGYAARARIYHNAASNEDLADIWRADWERHHRRAIEFFSGTSHRFLVCRIETDLPHLLNDRLPECKLDAGLYRPYGVTPSDQQQQAKFLRRDAKLARRHTKVLPWRVRSMLRHLLPASIRGLVFRGQR